MKAFKILAAAVSAVMLMSLASCSGGNGGIADSSTADGSDDTVQTTAPGTTADNAGTTEATAPAETTAPVTTAADETTAGTPERATVEVKWNFGYVGSDKNTQGYVNKIKPKGGSYSYTDVINIAKAGTKISFTDDNTNSGGDTGFASAAAYVVSSWKMENGEWVVDTTGANYVGSGNGKSDIAAPTADGKGVVYTYVTSKDDENIRLCFRSGQSSSFTPEQFPTVYVEFTGEKGTVSVSQKEKEEFDKYIEAEKAAIKYPALKGLTVNFLGDSYFAGNGLDQNYVWPSLLGKIYEMKYTNYGKNGSTVSDYVTTNNPMVVRYKQMADNNPDIVVFEGGKNDYNKKTPIVNNDDTGTKTFKGALNVMIDGLRAKYPNAVLICVTPWKVSGTNGIGKTVSDYADAMREICKLKNVPCFSADDPALSGVDMTDAAFRAKYSMTATDVSHLNATGHRLVLPKFEKFIADTYSAAKTN